MLTWIYILLVCASNISNCIQNDVKVQNDIPLTSKPMDYLAVNSKYAGSEMNQQFWILPKEDNLFNNPNCVGDRTVIVHLFNWKWTDIEKECVRFLGPKGFCGVQVSPPNEHIIVDQESVSRPWWERYQPVSYKLGSRSGNSTEFTNMVNTCNKMNIRIYVDVVINHMTASHGPGTGSFGSSYNSLTLSFPGVPYTSSDFNCCSCTSCASKTCGIDNYGNINEIRNCRLLGLVDLNLSKQSVRRKVTDYMNYLIDLGVAGFRVDAAKHVWPSDLKAIFRKLNTLSKKWFPFKSHPFIYNEVIDHGNGLIKGGDYFKEGLGSVTEFRFCDHISRAFRGHMALSHLKSFGEAWQMYPSKYSLVFVDNHDNQRGHGSGGSHIITFYEHRIYKLATAFMLAWPYGVTRIMSSYRWGWHKKNSDLGPPTTNGQDIQSVQIKHDGSCDDGTDHTWICEHRWRQIANMVNWRNIAGGQNWNIKHWWDNGGNHIAFARGGKAFIAINNDNYLTLSETLYTGLPSGTYCDIISGHITSDGLSCTKKHVHVDSKSFVHVNLAVSEETPIIAIHISSKLRRHTGVNRLRKYKRTVIFIYHDAKPETNLFIRGGINHARRKGCINNASIDPCAIKIAKHKKLKTHHHYKKLAVWQKGDHHLDWYGQEIGQQGFYHGLKAYGTPLIWTTNNTMNFGYHPLNKYGSNYWMADINMKCDQTENGWFEFKIFNKNSLANNGWEGDIHQKNCSGTTNGMSSYQSINHMARCSYINVFKFNTKDCYITSLKMGQ